MLAVADASFCAAWFLADESNVEAERLLAANEARDVGLILPEYYRFEMGNLLVMALRRKRIAPSEIPEAFAVVDDLWIEEWVWSTDQVARETLDLSIQFNLTFYDASYLRAAQSRDVPLLTSDKKLGAAAEALEVARSLPI